jgi:hypothetical protein
LQEEIITCSLDRAEIVFNVLEEKESKDERKKAR